MQPGEIVRLNDVHIEILEIKEGLPSAASYRFKRTLEDSSLNWFRWQDGQYVPFTPPAVGETVIIEGARFTMG